MSKPDLINEPYSSLPPSRVLKAFWSLNGEMHPANKVSFIREIDATEMDTLRSSIEFDTKIKPSYTALVTKATSLVLQEFPYANRAILGLPFFKRLVQFNTTAITVAIERSVPDADAVVLADTIYDCGSKSITEITGELRNFSNATMANNPRWRLFYSLLSTIPAFISKWIIRMPLFFPSIWTKHRGCACFVNSPAKYGIDIFIGDMIWPLTISFGWVRERPAIWNGELTIRKTMPLIMIFDRRIMAGAPAAKFFNRLAEVLQNAETELKE